MAKKKAVGGVGAGLGLTQGFIALALQLQDPTPNQDAAKMLWIGAVLTLIATLAYWFWPRKDDPDDPVVVQEPEQDGSLGAAQATASGGDATAHGPGVLVSDSTDVTISDNQIVYGDYYEATDRKVVDGGRLLIRRKPEDFQHIYDKNLTVNADRIVEPFIGKWMKLSGVVADVADWGSGEWNLQFADFGKRLPRIFMLFDSAEQHERLAVLQSGDHVNVIGKIKDIADHSLILSECELVED